MGIGLLLGVSLKWPIDELQFLAAPWLIFQTLIFLLGQDAHFNKTQNYNLQKFADLFLFVCHSLVAHSN